LTDKDTPTWEEISFEGGGVTSHHDLTNLTDGDDHTQYLLVSGSRAMTGSLNMGNKVITNLLGSTNDNEAVNQGQVRTLVQAETYLIEDFKVPIFRQIVNS